MVVLGEVVVAKVLQGLAILLLVLHMGCMGTHPRGTWGDPAGPDTSWSHREVPPPLHPFVTELG